MALSNNNNNVVNDDIDDDDEMDVVLPELEFGYRTTPMDWSDLQHIICTTGCLARLTRSVAQQTRYERFKRHVQNHWKSLTDYILCDKFQRPRCTEIGTGLLYAGDATTTDPPPPHQHDIQPDAVELVLKPNEFPYFMVPHVEHWVLWKLHSTTISAAEIEQAKDQLRSSLGDVVEFLHWTNPPNLRTVLDIDHVHILCLRREKSQQGSLNHSEEKIDA